jgi:hypothetical protein
MKDGYSDLENLLDEFSKFANDHFKDESKNEALKTDKHQKMVQSRNERWSKNKLTKSAATAQAARSSLIEITSKSKPFSNIDTTTNRQPINLKTFKQTFFNNQSQRQPYSRLNPLMKVLLSQYVLYQNQESNLTSIPFVFRLPTNLHKTNGAILNKKIQRKLSKTLNRSVEFWTYKEYDGFGYRRQDKAITHINGEILIHQHELKPLKEAFLKLAGDTIKVNPSLPYTIRFPVANRAKQINRYGEFYSVFNWVSYGTKQDSERRMDFKRTCFDYQIQKLPVPMPSNENFYYLSQDLGKQTANFYNNHIR